MSFFDPMHKELGLKGFWDTESIDSLIRATREDCLGRIANEMMIVEGNLRPENAAYERRIHRAILTQNDYIKPFETTTELYVFIHHYAERLTQKERGKADQGTLLALMAHWVNLPTRGVLEVIGAIKPPTGRNKHDPALYTLGVR